VLSWLVILSPHLRQAPGSEDFWGLPRPSRALCRRVSTRSKAVSSALPPVTSHQSPVSSCPLLFRCAPTETLLSLCPSYRYGLCFSQRGGYTPLPPTDRGTRVTYSFRINTCKSVSKQTTLTPFRMNTYEKQGGGGVSISPTPGQAGAEARPYIGRGRLKPCPRCRASSRSRRTPRGG